MKWGLIISHLFVSYNKLIWRQPILRPSVDKRLIYIELRLWRCRDYQPSIVPFIEKILLTSLSFVCFSNQQLNYTSFVRYNVYKEAFSIIDLLLYNLPERKITIYNISAMLVLVFVRYKLQIVKTVSYTHLTLPTILLV